MAVAVAARAVMRSHDYLLVVVLLLSQMQYFAAAAAGSPPPVAFDTNYVVTWGADHVRRVDQAGTTIELSLDKSSGAGFASKLSYESGLFFMRMKLPPGDWAGLVNAFYLYSGSNKHDELDIEILGNREGKPIIIQTNIFVKGKGNREQKMRLWFDPSADFHDYRILWNPNQVVFFVDTTPIRVYLNQSNKGIDYPSQPMQVMGSLWDGEDWATDGGKTKTNWSHAPFKSQFQGFDISGCVSASLPSPSTSPAPAPSSSPAGPSSPPLSSSTCSSPALWWNRGRYTDLTPDQKAAYQHAMDNYLTYDYCKDDKRFPVKPPECP